MGDCKKVSEAGQVGKGATGGGGGAIVESAAVELVVAVELFAAVAAVGVEEVVEGDVGSAKEGKWVVDGKLKDGKEYGLQQEGEEEKK